MQGDSVRNPECSVQVEQMQETSFITNQVNRTLIISALSFMHFWAVLTWIWKSARSSVPTPEWPHLAWGHVNGKEENSSQVVYNWAISYIYKPETKTPITVNSLNLFK